MLSPAKAANPKAPARKNTAAELSESAQDSAEESSSIKSAASGCSSGFSRSSVYDSSELVGTVTKE